MTCKELKQIDAWLDGDLSDEGAAELEAWLRADPANLETFARAGILHRRLRDLLRAQAMTKEAGEDRSGRQDPYLDSRIHGPESRIPNPESPALPIILDLSTPLLSPLSPLPSFVGGPVFSYMVATVIVGMMLLGAWAYKITHYRQIVTKQSPSINRTEMQFVGQVTGMKDCLWSDPQTETYLGASVPLNRRYALASGLMEISYDSGAKVILQGPCTYTVEARAGGYLALGKLTAKIGERGEGRGGRGRMKDEGRRMKLAAVSRPQAENLQISKSPNQPIPSSFILHHSSFVVRTPTAIVTDLGTEFGVEVSEEGNTISHVFRGSVKVEVVGNDTTKSVVLRENESGRVEKGDAVGGVRLLRLGTSDAAPRFVRRLYEPPKVLDLLDVVAGGRGTGNRREHGIDPASGRMMPKFIDARCTGDGRYWPVVWQRMIDGVFVPDGRAGKVQLDSAGHTFDGFPETVGKSWGSIWARAAQVEPQEDAESWVDQITDVERFMPDGRGLLAFCPNVGLTFDLDTVRNTYAESRPARFQATAGLASSSRLPPMADGLVDLWIFVDGRLKLKRIGLSRKDGPVDLEVELGPADRFLTLVSTDGGDGISSDWLVIGDPVLKITPLEKEETKTMKK